MSYSWLRCFENCLWRFYVKSKIFEYMTFQLFKHEMKSNLIILFNLPYSYLQKCFQRHQIYYSTWVKTYCANVEESNFDKYKWDKLQECDMKNISISHLKQPTLSVWNCKNPFFENFCLSDFNNPTGVTISKMKIYCLLEKTFSFVQNGSFSGDLFDLYVNSSLQYSHFKL